MQQATRDPVLKNVEDKDQQTPQDALWCPHVCHGTHIHKKKLWLKGNCNSCLCLEMEDGWSPLSLRGWIPLGHLVCRFTQKPSYLSYLFPLNCIIFYLKITKQKERGVESSRFIFLSAFCWWKYAVFPVLSLVLPTALLSLPFFGPCELPVTVLFCLLFCLWDIIVGMAGSFGICLWLWSHWDTSRRNWPLYQPVIIWSA